jgi:predicted NBD/HSP70 family sugar kinase
VGFPGHIHGGNKIVAMFHGRPGWENFPLADVIERRFKTEAFVLNNGNAYIRAERYFGQHNGARNLLGLYLDNAMSMGIIADGRLYQGETFAAGEIGHLSYGDASEQCHCGRLGCIERSGSEVYLLDKMNARLGTSYPTIKELLAHVERNTEDGRFVEQLIEDGLRILSRGITTIVTLLNPAKVLIHGGIVPLAPGHIERIRAYVAAHAFPASTGVSIELSTLDETACAMGAGAFFIERFYDIRRRYISDVLNSSPATR